MARFHPTPKRAKKLIKVMFRLVISLGFDMLVDLKWNTCACLSGDLSLTGSLPGTQNIHYATHTPLNGIIALLQAAEDIAPGVNPSWPAATC